MADRTTTNLPDVPSFSDFAKSGEGAWPKGNYDFVIVPSWTTEQGTTHTTKDTVSKKGDSRNLLLLVQVTNPADGTERIVFHNINYRPEDFSAERVQEVNTAKERNRGIPFGTAWDNPDVQRSFLSFQQLGQLEQIGEQTITLNGEGGISFDHLLWKTGKARLGVDEDGFNTIRKLKPNTTPKGAR